MKIDVTIPDGVSGEWSVQSFDVSEELAKLENLRSIISFSNRSIEPGTYKRLMYNGIVVMSNTPCEIRDHLSFIYKAQKCKNILINGLGLGVALKAILESEIVEKVDIVEISDDVINLVKPTFSSDSRVNIIHSDAFTYKLNKGIRYGAVWHDIWNYICADNLLEMTRLKRKYGRFCEWQGCWGEYFCKRMKRS